MIMCIADKIMNKPQLEDIINTLQTLVVLVFEPWGGGGLNRWGKWFEPVFNAINIILSKGEGVQQTIPLSKGENAVVLAQASYKCGEGVHPVGSELGGKLCCQ